MSSGFRINLYNENKYKRKSTNGRMTTCQVIKEYGVVKGCSSKRNCSIRPRRLCRTIYLQDQAESSDPQGLRPSESGMGGVK